MGTSENTSSTSFGRQGVLIFLDARPICLGGQPQRIPDENVSQTDSGIRGFITAIALLRGIARTEAAQ